MAFPASNGMKIILGSQSEGRKKMLGEMGFEFDVVPPGIDEKAIRIDDPVTLTLALANAKADAVLAKVSGDAIIISSDQVVSARGRIHEKPQDEREARERLAGFGGEPEETVTAVVVVNTANGKRREGVDTAKVWLKPLPASVVDAYIASGRCYQQAGGFSIDEPMLAPYIERIDGAPDSIIGLPKELTRRLIREVS